MTKFLQKMRKGKKGFTLIELLVVIAILGVIAAVAVPNILSFIGSGGEEAARAEQHNLVVAVTAFMVENDGAVPDLTEARTYLVNDLAYDWVINATTGAVTPDATGDNPLNP